MNLLPDGVSVGTSRTPCPRLVREAPAYLHGGGVVGSAVDGRRRVVLGAQARPDTTWAAELDALYARIAPHFKRAEVRARARRYLLVLLSQVTRKNGWQVAAQAGEGRPDGMQRLLNGARWDADAVRDDLRAYVVERLGGPGAVLAPVVVGFRKKGCKSVGVDLEERGEHRQFGVLLGYAGPREVAFVDRALYLPKVWVDDPMRRAEAAVPDDVRYTTGEALARAMLGRALDAGLRPAWVLQQVALDEAVPNVPALEPGAWYERRRQPYVLAVPGTQPMANSLAHEQCTAAALVALLGADAWVRPTSGTNGSGQRSSTWAMVQLADPPWAGSARWLLARRSARTTAPLSFYLACGPAGTPLAELLRVIAVSGAVTEGVARSRAEVGLDHYEVRRWEGWYRHVTLALLAYAVLVTTESKQAGATGRA